MATLSPPATAKRRYPGRIYIGLGIVTALLGLFFYLYQLFNSLLTTPWYLPVFGTVGLGLMVVALFMAWTRWRLVGVVLLGLFAGLEWYFILVFTVLPHYQGPVKEQGSFPAFRTTFSDGTSFTEKDLKGGKDTVMVFFRGRW
jgi:hypothetical protein